MRISDWSSDVCSSDLLDAEAVILVHNHPSGDPTPSSADLRVTERLAAMALSLDITVVDHIVVTATSHRNILPGSSSPGGKIAQSFGLCAGNEHLRSADSAFRSEENTSELQ